MLRLVAVFSVLLISLIATFARADLYQDGAAGALKEHNAVIQEFSELRMNDRVQLALHNLVMTGVQALKEKGYAKEAKEISDDWTKTYAFTLNDFSPLNLGDHMPLNQWLGKTYKTLEDKLGKPVMMILHLDDINVVNYGLPVAAQPSGDRRNGDHWNRVEYSRHFVPLITVVTYWSSLVGCTFATGGHPAIHKYCSLIAMICRNGMQSMFALKLSNYAYGKFSGENKQLDVNFENIDREYQTRFVEVPKN